MEPTKKSKQMENFLEETFGRTTAIKRDVCISKPIGCGKPIGKFRDELSEREYRISGLCQDCQDNIFGK